MTVPRGAVSSFPRPNTSSAGLWNGPDGHIWFARAESDSGGALTFHAGKPGAYDRPGIATYTIPTLVDYRGGTTIQGARVGNSIVMHVPGSLVGSPRTGQALESVTGWTVLDTGLPPFNTTTVGNVPTVVDATAAYDASVAAPAPTGAEQPGSSNGSNGGGGGNLATTGGPGATFGAVALMLTVAGFLLVRRRRRTS